MNQKIWENSNKLLAFNLEHEFLWKFQKTDDNIEGFISSIDGEKTDSMSISEIFAKMDNAEVVQWVTKNGKTKNWYSPRKSNLLYEGQFLGKYCKWQVRRKVNNDEIIKAIHNLPRSYTER